jgi:hypothetical protein
VAQAVTAAWFGPYVKESNTNVSIRAIIEYKQKKKTLEYGI